MNCYADTWQEICRRLATVAIGREHDDVKEFMQNLQICKLRENDKANFIEKGRKSTVHLLRLPWYSYDIPWIVRYTMDHDSYFVPTALEFMIHGISTLIIQ